MGHIKLPKLLATTVLAVLLAVTAVSAFSDTGNHKAQASISKWSEEYQIIQGYADGTFRPDNNITRGAFAGILNRVMHYTAKSPAGTFSDIRGNYWEDAILRLHAAGVYQGNNGRALPADSITRQQAAAMIARAFHITSDRASTPFSDDASISNYAKPLVAEMAALGYLDGVADGAFRPGVPITRGELVMILDNIVPALVTSPQGWSRNIDGNVMITSQSGANIQNCSISGDLIIGPGVTGKVTLTDVEISGETRNYSSITPVVTTTSPAVQATVVFKVVNGYWNDGTARDVVVALTAREGESLYLRASDIPAVGAVPLAGYKAEGTWSVTPAAHELRGGDREVYTFTYAAPSQLHAVVTFRVQGGAWSSGATNDIVVNLTGREGEGLALLASQIPSAGSAPSAGYASGGTWSPSVPAPHIIQDGASETYTFTYAAPAQEPEPVQPPASDEIHATVTFKIVGGTWSSGSTDDITVNLTAKAGEPLTLTASQIPNAGSRPADGYKAEGTWSPSTPVPRALRDGENAVYTFTHTAAKNTSAVVTFRVVNGAWDTGSAADVVVRLSALEGEPLSLTAAQIPEAGSRPSGDYKAEGTWSPSTPEPHTLSDGASETYTFTYTAPKLTSATVTFKVVHGNWNSGGSADIVLRLSGVEGQPMTLQASQIPAAGSRPANGYKNEGIWSPAVPTARSFDDGENTVYTYSYTQQRQIAATVTFKVVNGMWNSGANSDVVVNLTAQEGGALTLQTAQIPAVGARPATGYQASGAWSPSAPTAHTLTDGQSEAFTFTYAAAAAVPNANQDPWGAPVDAPGTSTTPATPAAPRDPEDEQTPAAPTTPTTPAAPANPTPSANGTIKTNVAGVNLPVNPLAKPLSSYPKNRKIQPSDVYTPSATTGEYFTYGSRSIPVYARLQLNQTKAGDFTWNGRRLRYVGSRYRVTFGVDVSAYQGGSVDWKRAKNNGVEFAIIRVARRTYGVGAGSLGKDANYARNLDEAMKAGIMTGAYVFSTAISVEEAIEEADYVLNLLKGHTINGPVCYDWEINASNYRNAGVSKEMATACAVAFCEKMLAAGYAPVVYISQYVGYVKYDMGALRTYLKWYPQYPATSNATPFPNFRYQVDMWQFSDSVTIPGIGSNIDSNLWFWPK